MRCCGHPHRGQKGRLTPADENKPSPPCGAGGERQERPGWGSWRNVKLSIHQRRQGGAVREHQCNTLDVLVMRTRCTQWQRCRDANKCQCGMADQPETPTNAGNWKRRPRQTDGMTGGKQTKRKSQTVT